MIIWFLLGLLLLVTGIIIWKYNIISAWVKKNYKKVFIILLASGLGTTSIILSPSDPPVPPPAEDDNWWVYSELEPYQIYVAPKINWSKFWPKFNQNAEWGLQYNNTGTWEWVNESLEVGKKPVGDNGRKLWLNFTAPYTGDYRFVFGIKYKAKEYLYKIDKYTYNLSYEIHNETFNLTFNFTDLANVPGIILNHGVSNGYIWLKARKNDVNQGKTYSIDPLYNIYSGATVITAYASSNSIIRFSNGTYLCTFYESNDVHIAWSEDDGETWSNREIFGKRDSVQPTIAIDSDESVVHLVWCGFTQLYPNTNRQIRYTNSTSWNNIINLTAVTANNIHPSLVVDANNIFHIVYEEDGASDSEAKYLNSTDSGGSWNGPIALTSEAQADDDLWAPSIAVNSTNALHVVYCIEDYGGGSGDRNSIFHIESTDSGDTWTGWNNDLVFYDSGAGRDSQYPDISIDDNDTLHVIWFTFSVSGVYDAVGYSHNTTDSSGWSAGEWVSGGTPTFEERYSSIGIVGDGNVYCAIFDVTNKHVDVYKNTSSSWTLDKSLDQSYRYPSGISQQYPVIDGLKTNRPKTGYAVIMDGNTYTNVTFYKSDDLTWDEETTTIYRAAVQSNGEDFFVWLGGNNTMSEVAENLSGYTFNGDDEISKLQDTGHFVNYTSADEGGADDVDVYTFDVIRTNLEDNTGDVTISMTENSDYTDNYENRTFSLDEVLNGYNYTGWSNGDAGTLGAEADAMSMANGYFIGVWDNSTYEWTFHIQGTSINTNEAINDWDVCVTKISADRTWNQS